jgi:multidrug efflux pump subunit AcrB
LTAWHGLFDHGKLQNGQTVPIDGGSGGMLAGKHAVNAAEAGARTRFRPVTMTAVGFIIGVLPLAFATGAGAGARRSIGTTVFGGVLLAKPLGILFVPTLLRPLP